MVHEFIELTPLETGKIIAPDGVRNSLAFDLRDVRFSSHPYSAALELPERVAARCSTARFLDPSTGRPYASVSGGMVTIPLSDDALRDLSDASGAFFYCDAVLEDERGDAVALPAGSSREWVLRLTHVGRASATNAHAIAA